MKKIFGIIALLLITSGYAAAADFWHFGAGLRLTGVMPGNDYANALGMGVLLTFGNPDSRFTTQLDLDTWGVTYQKGKDTINYAPLGDTLYRDRDHQYTGLGIGIFEKCRVIEFSPAFSSYVIGGLGGYFLDRKAEERSDNGMVIMKSAGYHSLFQLAMGLGFEGRLTQHVSSFVEGRFVGIISNDNLDKDLLNGYFGVRYLF